MCRNSEVRCRGLVLADTGLLDGHTATANVGVFSDVSSKHPGTTWVPNVRYVDDGAIVTSTTLAAGMDATLHVVDHGFQLVPRYDFRTVPGLHRVLVPAGPESDAKRQVVAAWSSDQSHRVAEDIIQNVGHSETAYDATYQDLARTQNSSLARADADLMFYAIDLSTLQGPAWSPG